MSGPHGVTRLTITVPMAPDRVLLPNNRRNGNAHWSVQAEATAAYRAAAAYAAVSQRATCSGGPIFHGPVIVSVVVTWPWSRYPGKRKMPDVDAVPTACKAAIDGIVDAVIIPDDGPETIIEIRAASRRGKKGEDGRTIIVIWEADSDTIRGMDECFDHSPSPLATST